VTTLFYSLTTAGKVTIVNVLVRGTQAAGSHITSWDGKNRGGRIVARGIYFIRAVGPGFDEFRKVLVA
jgi:flagellar hook assembly protein FlgD